MKPKKQKDECFVIMPFGGWFDDYYEGIYVPAIEAAGLCPRRADDIFRPSPIINDIWTMTKSARVILADLSKKNPNVFYELGLAHALSKPAVLVTEAIEDVPFDLQSLRVIVYNKDEPDWGLSLGKKIKNSLGEVLKSPQSAVLPTFLGVRDANPKTEVSPQELQIRSMRQELDSMRREMSSSSPDMPGRMMRSIPLAEAEDRVRHYMRNGMPVEAIIDRLGSLGVSPGMVSDLMRRYSMIKPSILRRKAPKKIAKKALPSA
jgi:hypothetical protein